MQIKINTEERKLKTAKKLFVVKTILLKKAWLTALKLESAVDPQNWFGRTEANKLLVPSLSTGFRHHQSMNKKYNLQDYHKA